MARALELAGRGLYTATPNPRVGCVIVREGVVAGEGWHERAGGPHAEVNALAAAGQLQRSCHEPMIVDRKHKLAAKTPRTPRKPKRIKIKSENQHKSNPKCRQLQ